MLSWTVEQEVRVLFLFGEFRDGLPVAKLIDDILCSFIVLNLCFECKLDYNLMRN